MGEFILVLIVFIAVAKFISWMKEDLWLVCILAGAAFLIGHHGPLLVSLGLILLGIVLKPLKHKKVESTKPWVV